MAVFARVVVGIDGTEWGFEALRQTLALAPTEGSAVHAVTALDTSPAYGTGFDAAYWVDELVEEATTARDNAASVPSPDDPTQRCASREANPCPSCGTRATKPTQRCLRSEAGTAAAFSGSSWETPRPSSCTTAPARC